MTIGGFERGWYIIQIGYQSCLSEFYGAGSIQGAVIGNGIRLLAVPNSVSEAF